jgi:hypothetical protein
MPSSQKYCSRIVLMLGQIAILALYSLVLYTYDNDNKLGIVISVCVVSLDIFTYFLVVSKIVDTSYYVIAMLALNRVFLVVMGQNLWIYGVMILYMFYGIVVMLEIAKEYYPTNNDVIRDHVTLGELCTKQGQAELATEGLSPVLIFVVLSALYAAIMGLLFRIEFKGKTLRNI